MKNIVTHIALPSMWSLPSLYPFVLDIGCRRHLVYLLRTTTSSYIDCLMTFSFSWWFSNIDIAQRLCRCFLAFTGRHLPCHTCIHYQLSRQRSTKMTTPAHRLLDHLLDDLKKELFAKMQQNVVLELEKRKRDLHGWEHVGRAQDREVGGVNRQGAQGDRAGICAASLLACDTPETCDAVFELSDRFSISPWFDSIFSVVDQQLALVTMVFSISCSFDSSNLKKEKQHDYIYQPVSSKCAYLPFKRKY